MEKYQIRELKEYYKITQPTGHWGFITDSTDLRKGYDIQEGVSTLKGLQLYFKGSIIEQVTSEEAVQQGQQAEDENDSLYMGLH